MSRRVVLWDTSSPEYRIWSGMKTRCYNPKSDDFPNYGGRGILVCDRWHSYINFLLDMDTRPSPNHTLERINNNGNYEPGNCKWSTRKEQALNRRPRKSVGRKLNKDEAIEIRQSYRSGKYTRSELALIYGISYYTVDDIIHNRIWINI